MITEEDRTILKSISQEDQAKDIAIKLNEMGIKPRRSKEYTSRTITRIMRGEQEDMNAEWAIFQHYHELDLRKQELKELRNGKLTPPETDQSK